MNLKKFLSAGIFSLITALVVGTSVAPLTLADNDNDTIKVCHATGSNQNPYNVQNPSKTGDLSGHDGHNGGVYPANPWGDIIPPFSRPGPDYLGKNWTSEGQAIYNNNCNIPTPWSVQIAETAYACGVNEVTISGTAQYGDDTTTTLLVKVNGNVVLDSESETANWSKTINVVPGQTYTVFAYVYDKSNPDLSGNHQDDPKATDTWQFTIAECQNPVDVCSNLEGNQESLPDGYHYDNEENCVPNEEQPTDVCPNLDGVQESLPQGYHFETVGEIRTCVVDSGEEPTPTLTPTPTNVPSNNGGTGGGDGRSDGLSSCPECTKAPQGQVLGASTMAGTGSFEQNLMNAFAIFGMLLLTAGYKSYSKEKSI